MKPASAQGRPVLKCAARSARGRPCTPGKIVSPMRARTSTITPPGRAHTQPFTACRPCGREAPEAGDSTWLKLKAFSDIGESGGPGCGHDANQFLVFRQPPFGVGQGGDVGSD